MSTSRYPTLIWGDRTVGYTALLVGDYRGGAAFARTEEEALRQLRELLDWRAENEPWSSEPGFENAELIEVKVEIRPQYKNEEDDEEDAFTPCPETVWLRVPCVQSERENGIRLCVIPHLGILFNFQEPAALKGLVAHYVREALQKLSPVELAGKIPPRDCRLTEVVLRSKEGRIRRVPAMDRPELKPLFAVADPLLHDFGRRGTTSAAYGRETLSKTIARKLQTEKANVLLVGEAGVGKSTLLLDAVKRVARAQKGKSDLEEEQSEDLNSYRFWRGSAARMIAGMQYLGEWEERCEEFVNKLASIQGIFCAENILELLQAGGAGPSDSVGAFLLPYLQSGELRMVAEATPPEVDACRRLLPGLVEFFQIVHAPAMDDAQAVEVLNRIATAAAPTGRLELAPGAIVLAHAVFKRFQPYLTFPGPAATFVRALCDSHSKMFPASRREITHNDVISLFLKQSGLPEIFLRDELPLGFEEVHARLASQIIGQSEATASAARLVLKIKAGLTDPGRPFGVLLFCGPTGVGKTALAKALADFCFGAGGRKNQLVRLDMSEFAGWNSAHTFLQNAKGGPASWIEAVRRQPFCVLLFDEIEKAAPEVFDLMLGLLDEGRLTDSFGRVTNFRSAIIILTSNLGSTSSANLGFGGDSGLAYESEVGKFFRSEFFNRLDAIIPFKPLPFGDVEAIARKELSDLNQREGFLSAGLRLHWSENLVAIVAREGYDRQLGVRPLQRAIERMVVTPLARWKVAHPKVQNSLLEIDFKETSKLDVRVIARREESE